MKNRLLKNLLLVVSIMLICAAIAVTASAESYTGECGLEGDNLTWSFDTETGVLSIDGEGKMDNYKTYNNISKTSAPWWDYSAEITKLDIGENVTSIGDYAFYKCTNLHDIDIPKNVTSISDYAFYKCENLHGVDIPKNVESIGAYAFSYCGSMTEVVIPDNVTVIGARAFLETKIKRIVLGDGLNEIPFEAFKHTQAEEVEFGNNIKTIGDYSFKGSYFKSLTIPNGVERIYPGAFEGNGNSIECISIPLSLKVIDKGAFLFGDVATVYYEGTIEQWEQIKIGSYNDAIRNATFHFGHAHAYTSEITTAPTCTETGVKTYTCECGESYTRKLSALGHDIVADAAVAATCTATGLTEGLGCSRCDVIFTPQEETPMIEHDVEIALAVAPTCTETGLTEGKACAVCGKVFVGREIVPALGHTEEVDKAVAATCTETGLTEGKHCIVCGAVTVEQEETPALGHKEIFTPYVEATCTETGLSVGKVCEVCGKVFIPAQIIPAKGHRFTNWIVTSEATCTSGGKKVRLCSCGLSEEEVIPATGHADENNDGKCDKCSALLSGTSEKPSGNDNVFSFLKSFLNNLLDFFRKLFKIK